MRNSGKYFVMLCFHGEWSPMMAVGLHKIALFEDEASAVRSAGSRKHQVFKLSEDAS